ncbi:MAG: hypothetical protein ABIQ04_01730 [Candidatus Saccharimonadales bacterium]
MLMKADGLKLGLEQAYSAPKTTFIPEPMPESDNELLPLRRRRRRDGRGWMPPEHNDTETSFSAQRTYSRRQALRIGAATIAGVVGTVYRMDINATKMELSKTRAYLLPVYDAANVDDRHKAIVITAGFGNLNSEPTAIAASEYAQYENVYATLLDDKGIEIGALANVTADFADGRFVSELEFGGYSMGGLIDLAIASKIHASNPNMKVSAVHLYNTPSDGDTLWPWTRDQGDTMVDMLSVFKDAEYSRINRFLVETFGARWHEINEFGSDGSGGSNPLFIDPQKLYNVAKYVLKEKIFNDDAASTALLQSQFKFILASGARDDILALGEKNKFEKKPPEIIYYRPVDPSADGVVNTVDASKAFAEYCKEANLTFIDVQVEGIGHADPIQHTLEHSAAIRAVHLARLSMKERSYTMISDKLTLPYAIKAEDKTYNVIITAYPRSSIAPA